MRRRSRAGGELVKARRRKTMPLKRGITPKAVRPRSSSAASKETKVALTRELNEGREQQAATAEVLKVISRSAFDLQAVLETLVELAVRLCDADHAWLFRRDREFYRWAASYGLSKEAHERIKQHYLTLALSPGRGSLVGRAALDRQSVQIADVLADPEYTLHDVQKIGDYRTGLGIPLLRENTPIGVLVLTRSELKPFTDKQVELLTTFADQAVIAIENTRLLNELRELLQQQTATADVLKVISRSTFDLQAVLSTLIELAARLCAAEMAAISLRDGDVFQVIATYGFSPEAERYAIKHRNATGRAALEGRAVHVLDVLADPEYRESGHQKAVGYRTILAVPLLRDGTTIGVFALTRREVHSFTDKQIKLVTTFADQAVIAIENVRLFEAEQQRTRELTESLDQQTAMSEVLGVISSSPGDLQPVFQSMLENAVRICDAKFGNIYRWDGELMHLLAAHNTPPALAEARRRSAFRPTSMVRQMVETKKAAQAVDLAADKSYTDEHHLASVSDYGWNSEAHYPTTAAVELGGVRTFLSVPLVKENELIGSSLYRQEVRPFTEKQIELVENFAAQAVIAIENTRLLNELRQRTDDLSQRTTDLTEALEQQTATSEVLQVISSSPGDLEPVFAKMLENAVRICDAKFGNIYRWDGDALKLVATHNTPSAFAEARRRSPRFRPGPKNPASRMIATKTLVHVPDYAASEAYAESDPVAVETVELGGTRTLLLMPMLKENELVGAFAVARQEVRPFTDKQIALVTNFAAQAVIAIENARLLAELRQRTDELGRSVEEQRALGEVSQAVNSTLDIETVLTTVVSRAVQLSRTDAGAIYVFDDERQEFRLHATYGMSETMIAAITDQRIGLGDAIGAATAQRKPIQVPDIVKQHGGSIEVDTQPGAFTEFRIILPRAGTALIKSGERT